MIKEFCDHCERELIAKARTPYKYDVGRATALIGYGNDYTVCEACFIELKQTIHDFLDSRTSIARAPWSRV